MPLTYAQVGERNTVRKIGGNSEIRKHLADLGFVNGADVTVISETGGNLIVCVKETRVAIGRDMAVKIMI